MDYSSIKQMFVNSINSYVMPVKIVEGVIPVTGVIVQEFIPFSQYISSGSIYVQGTFDVSISPINYYVRVESNEAKWCKILDYSRVVSFEMLTLTLNGYGSVGISTGYFKARINNNIVPFCLTYTFNSNTVTVTNYNFEEATSEDLPKISVDVIGRPRILSRYLHGNMLVEDQIELTFYSNYPLELDLLHSIVERYFIENANKLVNVRFAYPSGHSGISTTGRGVYYKTLRVNCWRLT